MSAKQGGIKFHFFESLVWLDLGLNPSLLDYWETLNSFGQWRGEILIYIYIYIYILKDDIYIYIYMYIYILKDRGPTPLVRRNFIKRTTTSSNFRSRCNLCQEEKLVLSNIEILINENKLLNQRNKLIFKCLYKIDIMTFGFFRKKFIYIYIYIYIINIGIIYYKLNYHD